MTGRKPVNVSAFVQWFKTMTTNEYIRSNPANWDNDDENPMCKSPRYVAMPNPQRP
jgi:hypothetical protein